MLTRNVLKHYRSADIAQRESGMTWYSAAALECNAIASATGYSFEQVACAMAHLSPRVRWAQNIHKTRELCETGSTYGMRSHINSARHALLSTQPLATFSPRAMKTYRFARNIIGDYQPVTVDMWAVLAATGERRDSINRSQYREIESAYQRAAKRVDLAPAQLQAVVWCVIRGSGE